MSTTDLAVPGRALAVGAHPDDIEFQAGATLAKWAAAGCEVHFAILTDGSKGTWGPTDDLEALVETRKREALDAAAEIGARQVRFLGEVDGELESGLVQRAMVCRAVREIQPDVVLGHDPWKRYRLHPDHRHAGWLTVDGVVAARDPHFFPEDGPPHRPSALLLFEADEPDHSEDVTGFVDAKVQALLRHRSQWLSTMRIGEDVEAGTTAFARRIAERTAEAGEPHGLGAAEVFHLIDRI